MPAVSTSSKILVTGASGFLATHVTRALLDEGHEVVGTVRTPSKGDYLVNLYKSKKLSYAIVEDIEAANAFDAAVKEGNFDGIAHVASPFQVNVTDAQDLIGPAVGGTTNILQSALKFGPTVKRIVITSSIVAIVEPHPTPYTYTESDWNDASIRAVEENKASKFQMYMASKTLAERAAWSFYEEHKSDISFDLSVLCPPYIFGPIIHEVTKPEALNLSHAIFRGVLKAKQEDLTPAATGSAQGYLSDVRTVAAAHSRAFAVEEAGGKRFILSDSAFSNQDIYDILGDAGVQGIPKGHPGSRASERNLQDHSRSVRVIGIEYPGLKEIVLSTYNTLKEHFPTDF
ncbi:NAD(P)-binding protein [Clavulina sp. PMI_390]|nr:NAD(P)-binding protein [Clavulina sp. PMI_390]